MTDDVLFLPGQRATRLRDTTTGRCAAAPDSAGLAVLGSGTRVPARGWGIARVREAPGDIEEAMAGACLTAARTPNTTPVVRGTRPAPGCTVVGGGAFEATRREAEAGPVRGTLRTGLPIGLAVLGSGTRVLARTPSTSPVDRGTRAAPGWTVVGGGALRTGLPIGLAVLGSGSRVLARTPSTSPVDRGTWPVPGCAVVGGGAFVATCREAETGPVRGALRAGLPIGPVGLGDVPTSRAVARAAPGDAVHQDAVAARVRARAAHGERR
ncbi:hypothetical protein ACFXKY_05850 [Streptomyces canus]|uniref:hypothetical protein n=1 Tax=Streptomyces canus TaxID=58343 RepID=UPI003679F88E